MMMVERLESRMGGPGAVEAGFQRGLQRQARAQFFLDALENENVAIDGRADRDEEAGDGGQGQRDWQELEDGDVEKDEDDQCQIGGDAGKAVIDQHESQDDDDADDAGLHAKAHGFLAEGGADFLRAFDAQRDGQRARPQLERQGVGFFFGELPGDDAAGRQLRLNDWGGKHFAIQHDRHRFANALACEAAEDRLILFLDFKIDHPFGAARALGRREHSAGRLQARARHHRAEGQAGDRMRAPARQRIFFAFGQFRVLAQSHLFAGHDFVAGEIHRVIAQAAKIDEFQQGGALDGGDGLGWVAHARQLHQDAVAALDLHGGFGQAKGVDAGGRRCWRSRPVLPARSWRSPYPPAAGRAGRRRDRAPGSA